MSKISDNASEGSYNAQQQPQPHMEGQKKKQHIDKFRHTKQGHLGPNSSVGGISDLKIDGGKTQTFHSDVEEYSNTGVGTIPGGQQALPPIIMPVKKAGKKKGGNSSNLATFNATKK